MLARRARRGAVARPRAVVSYATWNPATVGAYTLSNGNLTATSPGSTWSIARSTDGRTSGKAYHEVTISGLLQHNSSGVGIALPTGTATDVGNGVIGSCMLYLSGQIWCNQANTGLTLGTLPSGAVVGVALDMDNKRAWFRVGAAGNWNGSASNNPATNTGGVDLSGALGANPAHRVVVSANGPAETMTANFGASALVGAVPSGFTTAAAAPRLRFYVDNAAAGGGTGASWATAWNSLAAVQWGEIGAGATLYISGGSTTKRYNEALAVGAGGTASKPVVVTRGIDAGHSGEPIVDGQLTRNNGVDLTSLNHVLVSRIAAENHLNANFRVRSASAGVELRDCRTLSGDTGSMNNPGASLYQNGRGFDLRDNVRVGGGWAVVVAGCSVATHANTDGQTDGVYSTGNDGVLIERNTIVITNVSDFGHSDCVQTYQDHNVTIRGNWLEQDNAAVFNNHCAFMQDTQTGGVIQFHNNVCVAPNLTGDANVAHHMQTSWAGTGVARIYHNTIYGGLRACYIDKSPGTEVKNNVIWSTGTGGAAIRILNGAVTSGNINNNLLWAPSGSVGHDNGADYSLTGWRGQGHDAAGANANPTFTNLAGKDFRPQSTSAAKGLAAALAAVTTDHFGAARPSPPDAGAINAA